jgi:hypothetical protein
MQERPTSKEQELVFEAVTATMKQLKGSYSIISLIDNVRHGRTCLAPHRDLTLRLTAARWASSPSATPSVSAL